MAERLSSGIGGHMRGKRSVWSGSVEQLDPQAGTWSFKAPLSTPLHGIGAITHDARMYIFGGAPRAASASPREGGVNIFTP
jgi:hypothetical protein